MVKYAQVKEASSGFGMYETSEWTTFGTEYGEFEEGQPEVDTADINDWLGFEAEHGMHLAVDNSIDGLIYDQRGTVYSGEDEDGTKRYFVAYEE
jgi:hypothetical protein